jgi:hypothetical protein
MLNVGVHFYVRQHDGCSAWIGERAATLVLSWQAAMLRLGFVCPETPRTGRDT